MTHANTSGNSLARLRTLDELKASQPASNKSSSLMFSSNQVSGNHTTNNTQR